jgi:hypothetical protein
MPQIREYDKVRVIRLATPAREFSGSEGVARAPRIGDIATVCHEYKPGDASAAVVVEKVDEKGLTIWLADFEKAELELVSSEGNES